MFAVRISDVSGFEIAGDFTLSNNLQVSEGAETPHQLLDTRQNRL